MTDTIGPRLDAMHDFLDRVGQVRGIGAAEFGVTAAVDGSGRLIHLSVPDSLRGLRANDLAAAIETAVARAAEVAAAERAGLAASLHSSLTAP